MKQLKRSLALVSLVFGLSVTAPSFAADHQESDHHKGHDHSQETAEQEHHHGENHDHEAEHVSSKQDKNSAAESQQ